MIFEAEPQSAMAKVVGALLGPFMKRSLAKALFKDLDDIKRAAEATA